MSAHLRLESIVAGYGRGDILRDLDLDIEAKAVTCLVGPNGAGKSTVLKLISGLLRARRGLIALDGENIGGLSPAKVLARGVVHVAQDRSLFPLMTVWDNLLMGAHSLRDRQLIRGRAERIAREFPLIHERRHERAGSLSGGQQKLVEIARVLMLEPKLIMLDEPTMGLEPKARHLIFETVARLNESGHTVLLVEQNARAGLAAAHWGAVLDGGTVALKGSGSELLANPRMAELYLGGSVSRANGGDT
jgi:branched-chain amino acid transport system ATP-binding protein